MAWPTTTIDTTHMDQGSDNPGLARPDIEQMAININDLTAYDNASLSTIIFKSTVPTSYYAYSGATQISEGILIPADTFAEDDIFSISVTPADDVRWDITISPTNTDTIMFLEQNPVNTWWTEEIKHYFFIENNGTNIVTRGPGLDDGGGIAQVAIVVDWTVDNYLWTTTDVSIRSVLIEKY